MEFDRLNELGIAPLYDKYQPLSGSEIEILQDLIGEAIPHDYLEFVAKFGCSYFPETRVVVVAVEKPPSHISNTNELDISAFFGGGAKRHRILSSFESHRGRMPNSILPIADDYFGNLHCLGVKGNEVGRVYLWDLENEPDEEDYLEEGIAVPPNLMYSNLSLIAESFADYLSQLAVSHSDTE